MQWFFLLETLQRALRSMQQARIEKKLEWFVVGLPGRLFKTENKGRLGVAEY